jgi:hypothetical protein
MMYREPNRLVALLWRALLILAFAPAVLLIVGRLLSAILPAVIVAGVMLAIISLAVSGIRRRSEW